MALQSMGTPSVLSIGLNSSRDVIRSPSLPATPILPARPPSPERRPLLPGDSGAFLTALAGQERRVLELKEELERAESDLEKLKKQWALHETSKKKNEIKHIEQLRQISKPVSDTCPFSPISLSGIAKEHKSQKPPPTNTKQSQRKVFSGSRHTRTLSLLSPKLSSSQQTMSSPASVVPAGPGNKVKHSLRSEISIGKSPTMDISSTAANNPLISPPKDAILETGKSLVGDFREGLWMFFEDIRQATVGDEAISNSDLRNSPSSRNLSTAKKHNSFHKDGGIDAAPALEGTKNSMTLDNRKLKCDGFCASEKGKGLHLENSAGQSTFSSTKSKSVSPENVNSNESDDDGWENWDTPKPKDSMSQLNTSTNSSDYAAYTPTEESKLRTSISYSDTIPRLSKSSITWEKRDDIPWPSLAKLTPGNLKRTASTLMSEWERSLTPPVDEASDGFALSRGSTPVKERKAE